jgi:hypothetical protein
MKLLTTAIAAACLALTGAVYGQGKAVTIDGRKVILSRRADAGRRRPAYME